MVDTTKLTSPGRISFYFSRFLTTTKSLHTADYQHIFSKSYLQPITKPIMIAEQKATGVSILFQFLSDTMMFNV